MMFKKAVAAAAVALAFTGPAHALTTGGLSNGSLFLAVWDSSVGGTFSYAQDLGYTINSFLPNGNANVSALDGGPIVGDKTPDAGLNLVFNTNFLSQFSGNTADLRWNVVGYDNSSTTLQANTRRLVTTTQVGTTTAGGMTNSGLTTVTTNVGNTATFYGAACGLSGCVSNSTGPGWAGQVGFFGNTLGNAGLSTSQGLGGVLEMMYITQTGTSPGSTSVQAGFDFFDNAEGRSSWTMATDGVLSYAAGAPAAVPVPAAVWLFGSGLLGLVGIARRKMAA